MKSVARILSLLLLASLTIFYVGCDKGGENEKSEADKQLEKLNGTWAATTVTFGGSAPPLNHSSFSLTISGAPGNTTFNFTTSGRPAGPSAWPADGTFKFGQRVKSDLERNDAVLVSYSVTDTQLVMDFNFPNEKAYNSSGRTSNVGGDWHFEFTKQ